MHNIFLNRWKTYFEYKTHLKLIIKKLSSEDVTIITKFEKGEMFERLQELFK